MARLRRRNRSAEILTISILVALFFLAGLSGLLWMAGTGLFAGPTPTPSATPAPTVTATPDFRATRTQEDMLTQVAYSVQLATLAAHTLAGGLPPEETPALVVTLFPEVPEAITPMESPTVSVMLPVISVADAAAATATALAIEVALGEPPQPQPESPLEQPPAVPPTQSVNLPLVDQGGQPLLPTDTPTLFVEPTATWTPTLVPATPTPVPPPPPPPTPTIAFVVNSMRAVVDRQNAVVRVGPSSLYTQTGTINVGTEITLLGRDSTGEWLYVCCLGDNTPGWARGVSARPTLNPDLPSPLNLENADDVRWLATRGYDLSLTPIPSSTPANTTDWPMARRDRNNSGRVPVLPSLPLQSAWPAGAGLAGQAYISGAAVFGSSVLAASADGHLYSFDRESGGQRWRFQLSEPLRSTPLIENGLVYLLTESGRLVALEDQGNTAVQRWDQQYSMQPHGGLISSANRLVFTGRQSDGERLFIADRGTGQPVRAVAIPSGTPLLPAAGGQLVYVASDVVRAVDIFSGEIVWQSTEAVGMTAPPVFASPGISATAELYVADASGRLLTFDANTGVQLWATAIGGQATGLAVNNTGVFATGPGFVRAFSRRVRAEGQLLWNVGVTGNVLGGAIVDDARVFVATDSGAYQYFDSSTGALIVGNVQSPPLGGAVAVSGNMIFAPAQSGTLFAVREAP